MSLKSVLTRLADAIRAKSGSTGEKTLEQLAELAEGIEIGLDTSDATATAEDIVSGETAYANGEKITGTIRKAYGGITGYVTAEKAPGMPYAQMVHTVTEPTVISPDTGGTIKLQAPLTDFGDTTAEDVAAGKTFTSADGLKVTGTVPVLTDMTTLRFDEVYDDPDAGKIYATGYPESKAIVTPDTPLEIPFNLSVFGDATAKDVAKGKTFTSADGFAVTGTHECEAGLDTSDATATEYDIVNGETAYVNGKKVTGQLTDNRGEVYDISTTDGVAQKVNENGADVIEFQMDIWPGEVYDDATKMQLRCAEIADGIGLTPDMIVSGNTVLGVEGNAETGIDTSDATATASDMPEGVTAYVNGEKVTGSLPVKTGLTLPFEDTSPNFVIATNSGRTQILMSNGCFDDFVFRPGESMFAGSTVTMNIPAEAMPQFGDATAEDVTAGKTFTSLYGVKLTGTKENAPATQAVVLTADATPSANSLTLEFTGLSGEPTLFSVHPKENITLGSTRYILGVDYDGENTVGIQGYSSGSFMSSSATATYSATAFSWTYANGTLTVTSGSATTGGYFMSGITYQLVYITDTLTQGETSGPDHDLFPDGAIAVQIVKAAEASTQVGSGYSLSITYGDAVEISDSIALAFSGTTNTLSNISDTTDFSVLLGKYIRSGSTTTAKYYYIPDDATFTVGSSGYSKTLTCDKAQAVSMQKVST